MYQERLQSLEDLMRLGYQVEPNEILINTNIAYILKARGMTTTELSEKVGVSRQTIYNILNESYTPGVDLALKIAEILQEPVETLFSLKENAWFSRVKKPNEKTLYIDHLRMNLVDQETKKKFESEEGILYIDTKDKKVIDREGIKFWEQELRDQINKNPKTILKETNQHMDRRRLPRYINEHIEEESKRRFLPVFQKLVKRLDPNTTS